MTDLDKALTRLKKDKVMKRRARVAQELANVRKKPGLADQVADAVTNQKSPGVRSVKAKIARKLDSFASDPTSVTKSRNIEQIRMLSGHDRK